MGEENAVRKRHRACPRCKSKMEARWTRLGVTLECSGCALDFGRKWYDDEDVLWQVWDEGVTDREEIRKLRLLRMQREKEGRK